MHENERIIEIQEMVSKLKEVEKKLYLWVGLRQKFEVLKGRRDKRHKEKLLKNPLATLRPKDKTIMSNILRRAF